jgi:outer membrane protein OmpA-like peptidoglycan-associated protein
MPSNLIDSIQGFFNNDFISRAASSLGEGEDGIRKALLAAVPTSLAGLLNKTNAEGDGSSVLGLAQQALSGVGSGNMSETIGSAASGVKNWASGIFGDKLGPISQVISKFAGVKESSATTLVNSASAATLGAVGKYASDNNLNASGIKSFLQSQKDSILSALPSGLNLGSILSLAGLGAIGSKVIHTVEAETKKGSNWLIPLLVIIVAIALIWYFVKGCGKNNASAPPADTSATAAMPDTSASAGSMGRESMQVQLPNGTTLNAFKGGIEDQLVTFLKTPYKQLGADSLKNVWFDFDNLTFETGSANIAPQSQTQIDNIAAILKAFPDAKLKIGGYTDKTGDDAGNMKLSSDRANAVKAALEKDGVGSQITDAEGYGSKFAKFPADAAETDKVKDRHISVSPRL